MKTISINYIPNSPDAFNLIKKITLDTKHNQNILKKETSARKTKSKSNLIEHV